VAGVNQRVQRYTVGERLHHHLVDVVVHDVSSGSRVNGDLCRNVATAYCKVATARRSVAKAYRTLQQRVANKKVTMRITRVASRQCNHTCHIAHRTSHVTACHDAARHVPM
jgi:hypothetical protein